jgi:glycosyltransferase 2 family protein
MKSKNKLLIFKISISFLIILFLFTKLNIDSIFNILKETNLFWIFIAIILKLIVLIFGALNIKLLIIPSNKKIRFVKLIKDYSIAWSIGSFIPLRIGEFSIIYFLKKNGLKEGIGLSISLIDRIISTIVISIVAIFGLFYLFRDFYLISILVGFIILLIISMFIITNKNIRLLIRKYILKSYSKKFSGFSEYFILCLQNLKIILLNFLITLIKWIINALAIYLIFISLNTNILFKNVFLISCMGILLSLIPITFNGLGVREASFIFFYSKVGINANISMSVSIILLVINYIIPSIILIFNLNKFDEIKIKYRKEFKHNKKTLI